MTGRFTPYRMTFKSPVLTSRGQMTYKNGYYLLLAEDGKTGIGECSYIEGLSIDDLDDYEMIMQKVAVDAAQCYAAYAKGESWQPDYVRNYPSILFGMETAALDLMNGGKREIIAGSKWYNGEQTTAINGLIWMGSSAQMQAQMREKVQSGYKCIKLKVGAIDFDEECRLIEELRAEWPADQMEIRLDANGAFNPSNVRSSLERLAQYHIHSIEQPIKPGQTELMNALCREQIIPIALDEELIGINDRRIKERLLEDINPQYIILKPSLIGGMQSADEWIALAEAQSIGWWSTSALESNIGLNAIAQWAAAKQPKMVQGLGTGSLYVDNIPSPLYIEDAQLKYDQKGRWDVSRLIVH